MTDEECSCCDRPTEPASNDDLSGSRFLDGASPLDVQLPPDVQSALGSFLGEDAVRTLGAWAREVRARTGGTGISVDDLCLTDESTEHWGRVDGDRYYFRCFYDAVILAALTDRPVDVRTRSPEGSVIEARAVGSEELTVTPADTVFSFGIEKNAKGSSDETDDLERGYAAICPYVNAFPNEASYVQWATAVPAATVALPFQGATALASALVEEQTMPRDR